MFEIYAGVMVVCGGEQNAAVETVGHVLVKVGGVDVPQLGQLTVSEMDAVEFVGIKGTAVDLDREAEFFVDLADARGAG